MVIRNYKSECENHLLSLTSQECGPTLKILVSNTVTCDSGKFMHKLALRYCLVRNPFAEFGRLERRASIKLECVAGTKAVVFRVACRFLAAGGGGGRIMCFDILR